jgi:hypothetical protein
LPPQPNFVTGAERPMSTSQQEKEPVSLKKADDRQFNAVIEKHVMRTLGRPGDLQRVQVRRLWDDHYRVNIVVGPDLASATIPHSYFLVVDSDGNIMASNPAIARQY